MRDSNVANAAKESAQDEFPHGLQNARIAWSLLTSDSVYDASHSVRAA